MITTMTNAHTHSAPPSTAPMPTESQKPSSAELDGADDGALSASASSCVRAVLAPPVPVLNEVPAPAAAVVVTWRRGCAKNVNVKLAVRSDVNVVSTRATRTTAARPRAVMHCCAGGGDWYWFASCSTTLGNMPAPRSAASYSSMRWDAYPLRFHSTKHIESSSSAVPLGSATANALGDGSRTSCGDTCTVSGPSAGSTGIGVPLHARTMSGALAAHTALTLAGSGQSNEFASAGEPSSTKWHAAVGASAPGTAPRNAFWYTTRLCNAVSAASCEGSVPLNAFVCS
mmetsp:Transcript_12658/g.31189  ORF Transcript_12658/g.31189 Transcript_12658/m.31189 type:complete len:286 (+) Transcript_12658:454-1311(+)